MARIALNSDEEIAEAVTFEGKPYPPPKSSCWKTDEPGMQILARERRLVPSGETLRYVLYHDDYPVMRITNLWADTSGADDPVYAVQTNTKVIQRCMFMSHKSGRFGSRSHLWRRHDCLR